MGDSNTQSSADLGLIPLPTPPSSQRMTTNDKKRKVREVPEQNTNSKKLRFLSGKDQKAAQYLSSQQKAYRAGNHPVITRTPRNMVQERLRNAERQGNAIRAEKLRELSAGKITAEQIASLDLAKSVGPNFLGRTASLTSGYNFGQTHRKTNGFTAQDLLMPSADTREKYFSHQNLTDLTQGEIVYMCGHHLRWTDLCGDEFLSYSKDPLFLVVHALRRHHEKQGNVTIQFIDRRKARTQTGNPAAFYNALDIYTMFELPKWRGWDHWTQIKLHPRKFTQEFLTHGTVLYHDPVLKQALIEDLIRDGLYEIFPDFAAPEDHKRAGLYTLQVVLRKIGFPPPVPKNSFDLASPIYSYDQCSRPIEMKLELLETVRKVTLNFCNIPEESNASDFQPPLHIFICFLTFQKRNRHDPVLEAWIKKHYTAQDVLDLYTDSQGHMLPGFTSVANNLPGYMQYLDLVRDCIALFGLRTALPPNAVESEHVFHGTVKQSFKYAAFDDRMHRFHVKSEPYNAAAHEDRKQEARRRRARARADDEGADDDQHDSDNDEDDDGDEGDASALAGFGAQGQDQDEEAASEEEDGLEAASQPSPPLDLDDEDEAALKKRKLIEAPSVAYRPSWLGAKDVKGRAARGA